MSNFPAQVYALSAAARELRLALLENQGKISWIDAYAHTHLLEEWKRLCEEYRKMLDKSESAATELATAINTYVSLQEYMDDPTILEDLIEEFRGLSETLSKATFCQDGDFSGLRSRFEKLGEEIDVLLKSHTAHVEDPVNASREAFTRSPQEPVWVLKFFWGYSTKLMQWWKAMANIADWYLTGRWGRTSGAPTTSPPTCAPPMRAETANASGKPAGPFSSIQAMPAVLQMIEKNLETQKGLSTVTLVDTKNKLTQEIQTYLTALRNAQAKASPENQLALRNTSRRIISSTETWKERAKALSDGYAKVLK